MQFDMITTQTQLHDFIATLDDSPISLDTEFVRTRTYLANLGLLQISQNNKITLIDPLAITDLSAFWSALNEKKCILHASSEDLEIIREHKGDLNIKLFDTQVACAFLNLGASLGYAKMVETLEGIVVDKGESRTDWCQRPLSAKQINYAAIDVLYLQSCLENLQKRLEEKKMTLFFEQECQMILNQKMQTQDPEKAYKSFNNLFKLDRQGLAVIKALATWRLLTAKSRNLALNFVVKEDHLWLLAHYRPASFEDLHRLHLLPNEIRIHGDTILAIIKEVAQQDPETYPPMFRVSWIFQPTKRQLKQCAVKFNCARKNMNYRLKLIASKRIINEYLSWLWKLDAEQKKTAKKPKLLSEWRFELIGHQFEH
ncbi:ribonuclease D [Psychromonas sp. MME2]|uniref:ribonuclease D n=1 Tax=Psychromonas sp. MME2 TaxID=3231033 RepID=UPI00339C2D64